MSKGLETLKNIVENNIKFSTEEIDRYMNNSKSQVFNNSISYFEGIKSTNEGLLAIIEHEIKLEEIEVRINSLKKDTTVCV